MLNWLYDLLGTVLAFFYSLFPERSFGLGLAIILLTVLVMLVLFPLTAKQAKGMLAMQRAAPEIKKIQAKYKNDRTKQNEEVMKFYQENQINPLSGCLPLVVQMPVFISLFRVLREPYKHVPTDSKLFRALCGTVANRDACTKGDLPHHLKFLGMDLSQHATAVKGSVWTALPYFVMVALVVGAGFLQSRQSQRNNPNLTGQMAVITKVLPVGTGLLSLIFPSGLVLYFLISSLWRVGQQEIIVRHITGPATATGGNGSIDVKSTEPAPEPTSSELPAPPASSASRAPRPGGALRRMFQAPPPPGPTPGRTPPNGSAKPTPGRNGAGGRPRAGSAGGSASPGARRRNGKKRRKR
jgi:YidC/Oxa1 family membrane protein insertase